MELLRELREMVGDEGIKGGKGGGTSDGRLLVFLKVIVDEAEDEGGLEGRIMSLISP